MLPTGPSAYILSQLLVNVILPAQLSTCIVESTVCKRQKWHLGQGEVGDVSCNPGRVELVTVNHLRQQI